MIYSINMFTDLNNLIDKSQLINKWWLYKTNY